ncbi:YqjF family protein [Lignipirellula cremea]|uniref:DUF2071 domain-containing protein n=1 Tax=Lignipirellula cremea TaxID=2528010 RepID=A0A518DW93_9BACT|nr:DUF2071 domain-containing protein [Lignipirellula cremea]QDU96099.1 hypothetical protein Pla8534_39180 [Lignipirellula cremea]
MHSAFSQTDHRPWKAPASPWTWRQSWRDLLFMHWPVPADVLRSCVPREVELQEFDGSAWIGIVPFRMAGVMRRPLPDMPWISAFPEINVRTYVETEGKPGVWFLSLDATNPLAIWAASRFFYLPYYRAQMSLKQEGDTYHYYSRRTQGDAAFEATWRPTGDVYASQPGTLESWLTERYCLYAQSPDGRILRNEVQHVPWPLQPAAATITNNTMLSPWNIDLPDSPPLLHFAKRLDVVVWNAEVCPTSAG